jgi:CDP-diacylglycerol--glycerol-3-phosphate 3-phosphatidyltransferase
MKLNLPILLTLSRILVIPIFIVIFLFKQPWSYLVCTWLFIIAAVTDWLDGYLARKYKQTSRFGAFLDPVADKLMVTVVLVLLVAHNPVTDATTSKYFSTGLLAFLSIIIIGREIMVSALREWMAEAGERSKVAVSIIGKVKTAAQLFALPFMIYKYPLFGSIPVAEIGFVLLMLTVVLTLWSMLIYLKGAWPALKRGSEPDSGS